MYKTDFTETARQLGPSFAATATARDEADSFVAENYEQLRAAGFFTAHVPADLGGAGASHAEMAATVREIAHYCGSTALAFSMHTHLVAAAAWRFNHGDNGGEGLLRRVAGDGAILVSSGGADWLESGGTATKVEGGYRITARKPFSSGSPAGDILVTSAIYDDPADGPTVLHFGLTLRAEGVTVEDNWRAIGMRGTGSNDVVIEDAFVPDAAISGRRPVGKWGPFHLVSMIAFPLIYSAYVGVAEAARDLAISLAAKRQDDAGTRFAIGEMENELRIAQMALDSMIAIAAEAKPGPQTTNEMMIRRTIAGKASIATVEKAMEAVGGASFQRATGIERLLRDVQGARFHPLTEKRQLEYTGRLTFGLPIE